MAHGSSGSLLRAAGALLLLLLLPPAPPAAASACSAKEFLHNGSLMEVQRCDGGALTITYKAPRPGIAQQGAGPGTLFFNGIEKPDGTITGQARLFSARCGIATYPVTGSHRNGIIALSGTAPIRGKGCRVVRHQNDYLLFTPAAPYAGRAPGPHIVPAQCPPGQIYTGGQCVPNSGPLVPARPFVPPPVQLPAPGSGDWYAIAGSFRSQAQAEARAQQLGGVWHVLHTQHCPNMTPGYWIATAGGFSKSQAQAYARSARRFGAYAKRCH
ncbi:MAG: hypothetical protein D6773_00885 [Alphaproteobacteria bacterium]|nr:MAG: hypothetical protein D6773_00885 [Alphaproteobacteria bacterium]